MLEQLDYQVIINLCGSFLSTALPIGIIIGLSEKLVNLFFSICFGDRKIKM